MEKVRKARLSVYYDSKDITEFIQNEIIQFRYTDYAHGKSDEVDISLSDRDGKWHGAWFVEKGAKLKVGITVKDWISRNDERFLNCGIFTIDEVEYEGLPDIVNIKGVSSFITESLRLEKKTIAYENKSLKKIGEEIAGRNGLNLFFDGEDIVFKRIDQKEESDLGFLKRICEEYGYNLKVSEGKLILYEGKNFDIKKSLFNIVRKESWIKKFRFSHKTFDIYRGCRVKYWDSEKKKLLEYQYMPEGAPEVGQILQVNERVEGLDKAIKKARAELRKRNKYEIKCALTVVGDVRYNAGVCFDISGFGVYDGKYFVESVSHIIDRNQGYVCEINGRKCLEY